MRDPLIPYSGDHRFILDNEPAKIFLAEVGMLGDFAQDSLPAQSLRFSINRNHPTHWILAHCHAGHKNEADNGYAVFCFLKRDTPLVDVENFNQLIHQECQAKAGTTSEIKRNRN